MRRWWDRLFVVLILAIAGLSIYAVWPDEPDRYLPDAVPWPSGQGVPGTIAGLELPCHSDDASNESDSADCKGIVKGLDLEGGSRIVMAADLQGRTDIDVGAALRAAKEVIENRINPFGVSESSVQVAGDDRLIVELPGVSATTARDITRPAILMFCEGLQPDGIQGGAGSPIGIVPEGNRVIYKPGSCEADFTAEGVLIRNDDGTTTRQPVNFVTRESIPSFDNVVWTPAKGELDGVRTTMTGAFLKSNSRVDIQFAQPRLIFSMTGDGEKVFGSLSERMIGLPLATFLDGEPIRGADGEIIAPTIQSQITDTGTTTGLTLKDAQRLSTLLNNGAFPIPLRVIQQTDVDATLGDEAVRHSVEAGIVALLLIMAFMTLYYRLPGALASVALVVYSAVVLAIFKIGIPGSGPVTITLAGVAAFVLSVGMAVDANILIFERMREELRNGRSLIPAISAGFDRAWSSIRDSNIATLITCAILYWMGDAFGSPLIKGFALTLAIGVLVSLFSAITVTRTFLRMTMGTPLARVRWLWTDDRIEDTRRTPAGATIAATAASAEAAEHA
jgi:preprotein translocase subunit SecD